MYQDVLSHFITNFTFNLSPDDGLSGLNSLLISSSSSSLGEMHVIVESLLIICSVLLGNRGEGKGVGRGVGKGVGSGVGSSRMGERHLLIPLGTSRRIDGGCNRLPLDDTDLCTFRGSTT